MPETFEEAQIGLDTLIKAHESAHALRFKKFSERVSTTMEEVEKSYNTPAEAEPAEELAEPMEDPVPEPSVRVVNPEPTELDDEEFEENEMTRESVPREQRFVALSFIETLDEDTKARDPYGNAAVCIHGLFETETKANEFVDENLSAIRDDCDVIIACTGQWLYPDAYYSNDSIMTTRYRDAKLNEIISNKRNEFISAAMKGSTASILEDTMAAVDTDANFGIGSDFINFREVSGGVEESK